MATARRINVLEDRRNSFSERKDKGKKKRNRRALDGAMSAEELAEILARQNKPVGADAVHIPVRGAKVYRTGSTWETAKRKPSHEISKEERIASLENDIGEFREGERRYVKKWVDIYPNELQQAIYNREKKGERITDKAVAAIRLSLINHIAKWGMGRGMAPEKSNLIEKYLELKLPHGIPPESAEELHIGEREAIKKNEKEKARAETDLFMKRAADSRQTEIDKILPGKGTQIDESLKDLNKKNKYMEIPVKEITNIREQLKQDKEELKKAGMMKNDADPHPGGKFEEDMRAQSKKNQDKINDDEYFKKEKEPEFSPEEMKSIQDMAYYISERRMAGENESAREWQKGLAREYGLDENAFSKEVIEELLDKNGLKDKQWTPEAQKFMQDWDRETAKEAFRNMKKAREQASEADSKDVAVSPDKTAAGDKSSTATPDQQPYKYTQGDEAIAFSKDWKEKKYENVKPAEISPEEQKVELDPNNPAHVELIQAITNFEANQSQISETRAKKAGRFASLWKTLGIKTKNLSEDPEVMGLEKESQDKYRDLIAKGIRLFHGDKPKLEIFLKQFDEFEVLKQTHNQEMEKRGEVAGFPENILAGFHKIGKRWSEMGKWQKLAIGAAGGLAIAGGGMLLGAGTFGAASLGMGWRWGFRAFGAMSAGIGRKVLLDKKMMEGIDKTSAERLAEKMKFIQDYENNLDAGIAAVVNSGKITDARKNFEEKSLENTKKAVNLAAWSFTISSIVGESLRTSGISFGSVARKFGEYTGVSLAGVKESAGNFLSAPQANTEDAIGHGGLVGYGTETSGHEFVAAHPEGKYGSGLYGTEGEGHISEPEVKAGGSLQNWAETTHATGAETQVPEIAPVKIVEGSNMWATIQENIKANPKAYGLDPADPNFKANMNGKIVKALHEFADKNGLKYKQLDKVFAGDSFKMNFDDATGKISIDDFHGKGLGGKFAHLGSGAEVPETGKPSVAFEDLKPKTGAVAEHQPARGGGKMKFSPEIEEMDRKGQMSAARALESQQHADNLKAQAPEINHSYELAHTQQVQATGSLLKRVFEGAGMSDYVNVLKKPMSEWQNLFGSEYHISQDVQLNDATDKMNVSLSRLRELYPILKQYASQGSGEIGDCLSRAMRDPLNVSKINEWVLAAKR